MTDRRSTQVKKSYLMLGIGVVLWALLAWKYNPLLLPMLNVNSLLVKGLVVLAILWINVVWLYGVVHVLTVIFSLLAPKPSSGSYPHGVPPKVAILYTVCNDFCPQAAESCLGQNYATFNVFLLDDSTDAQEMAHVWEFWAAHKDACTLVRRGEGRAYKAGNLNHTLAHISDDYPYFAVVDADEVLPHDFLSRLVPYFSTGDRVGFVQADHRYRRASGSRFAQAMTSGVDLHWGLFLPARNKYGFVMFYGHGAVVRTEVWKATGGFPEVVSEDIAFAAKARELGYYGVFTDQVAANESFPEDYGCFLKRETKIVKGTLQFLLGPARSFFRSPAVTMVERADLLGSALVLFLPLFFLGFVVAANILLPLLIAISHSQAGTFGNRSWHSLLEPFGADLKGLWTWDFYLVTVISILSPLAYQLRAFLCSPKAVFLYAARSTAVFLSIVPAVAWAIVGYLCHRKVEFQATGDRTQQPGAASRPRATGVIVLGLVLAGCAILCQNYAVLTTALAFLLHPLFLMSRRFGSLTALGALVPFLCFVAVFGSIPFLLVGLAGALAAAVPAHH